MRIEKVRVEGFRLLQDVEIMLETGVTIIVGRNNSGKTSLTDVFDRFVGDDGPNFRLEDFSAQTRNGFIIAKSLRENGAAPEVILDALPKIAITLTFEYSRDANDLGPLSPFIIDLEEECTRAIARIEYAPTLATLQTLLDVPKPEDGVDPKMHFFRCLRETLPRAYRIQVFAVDPTDANNQRRFEGKTALTALVQCNLVRAQRTLDHSKKGDPDVIGKTLSTLYKTATTATAAEADRTLAAKLKSAVEAIEHDVQTNFDEMLKGLLPALEVFGFPSLNDTEIHPETSLNVEAMLSDHTKIVYAGADDIHLPEGYNGLGTRNLIYMLLQLESHHKAFRARATRSGTHVIFIEEPEAHLHPQMQEVFIKQLTEAVGKLSARYSEEKDWPVQFVITTHSSHVANAAAFDAIRYFLNEPPTADMIRHTKVKDFKKGAAAIPLDDQKFLQKFMTLTKCDLYFADKAILVEGPTERILMPRLCEIVDKGLDDAHKLARQYITAVEVGGASAHLFYPLLDFLELKTLIITDLDAVKAVIKQTKGGKNVKKWEKCLVAEGERTSNAALVEWFRTDNEQHFDGQTPLSEPPSLDALVQKSDAEKIKGCRRIAYQVPEKPESWACARSFEDALVLANPDRFLWPKEDDEATEAWDIAQELHKTETAFRFAIKEENWNVPRYIREGLIWLSEPPLPLPEAPQVEGAMKEHPQSQGAEA